MSDFRIRVNVELDTKDLKSQLEGLNENIELKLDTNKINSQLKELKGAMKDVFNIEIKNLKDLTSAVKSIEKLNRVINNTGKIDNQMKDMVNQYKDLANVYSKLEKQMNSGSLGENSLKRSALQLSELKTQMSQLYDKMDANAKAKIDLFNTKQSIKGIGEMNNYLNKIETTATSLGTKLKSISFDHIDTSKIEKIQNELKEIQDTAKQDINLELNVGDILSDLDRISNEIKNLEKVENLASSFEKISSSVADTSGDIERLSSEIKSLENVADSLDGSFGKAFSSVSKGVKDFQSDIKKIQKDTSSSLSGKSIFGDWNDFTGSFSRFKIADLAGDAIADSISRMATAWKDTIVETDSAITDLNKVLDKGGRLTGQSLDNYLGQVTQVAKGTGKSSTDVIQGTARAVQSGIKSTEDALKYAEKSAMFANIGDMTQEQADKILTSVMSANGGIEKSLKQSTSHLGKATEGYSKLEEFIDMANHAGNNFAVTTADVGTAMMLSTNALSANGVAMEEQIAMAVAMNEVLQDSSRTGNALKSISANMSGVIFGLKEGDVQANKTAKALESLTGIKLFDEQTGEVMDMYEAMEQLNGKWDGLTEAQKSSIAQTIAGKQNLQSFLALMDNWDTARQYVDDYNKSVGEGNEILRNATDENEQYLDSVQGKWNSIKEDLKATGLNLIDSEMAKDGLDVISAITSVLPKASEKANEFYSTLMGGNFAEEMSDKFYEAFEKIDFSGKLKGFSSKISDFITNTFGDNKITNAISDMFKGLSGSNFLNKWMTDVSTLFGKSMDAITNLIPGISSLKGVGEILNIDSEKKQLEDSIDGHKNRIGILREEIGSMAQQQKDLNRISEEYEKLSKNTKRSAEEEKKYLNLKNEIASANPDLVLGYDSSGSPILKDLKLQNEQYDRQIKLKQQSLRLEENALATDTQKQRLQNLEDYNKALEEYNNSQLYSDTKRKDGFFTDESLQDYAKRLKESNANVEKANLESYSKRLEDHQKYLNDERAIQEKYINQMENSNSFEKMSESARQNMLTFMDTLNWSEFSDAQASSFARQLEDVSNKIVSTTDEMGEYGKKINEISDAYANNESNMIGYTKALGDIYEASGKLDNQSLMQWFDSLKQYGSLTGDLNGVNACINEMATSLEKVTGIDASTWKTAFKFDPAPIDASSKALQNFLKSYNTGVQNLGKGGLADKLKTQFETLQSSYLQLTEDVANGGEIDIEYLANIKINQPEPIQNLIDEIISDNEVTEQEIELLMTVMPEILNTGEISEETYQQIADVLDMDVQEVKAKFNINAEVDGNFEEVQKYVEQWDGIKETDKQLLLKMIEEGGSEIEEAISKWDSLSEEEKQQTLRQLLEKDGDISEASQEFENAQEGNKEQTLKQKAEGKEELQAGKYTWEEITSGDKNNNLNFKVSGKGEVESGKSTWDGIKPGNKEQTLKQKAEGKEEVKSASDSLEKLPSKKEVVVEIVQSGKNLLDSIANWFDSKAQKQTISVTATVTGEDAVNRLKTNLSSLQNKSISVSANVSGSDLVNTLKTNISGIQGKSVAVRATVSGTSEVNTLKAGISSLQGKSVSVKASVTGTNLVQALTNAINAVKGKTVNVTANVKGTSETRALTNAINAVKSKSVSVKASVSGTSAVRSLASAIASVNSKTVSVRVNKTVTTTQKTVQAKFTPRSNVSTISNTPSTINTTNLSSIPISASDTPTSTDTSLANIGVSAKASSGSSILEGIKYGVEPYKELEQALDKIASQFDIIDKKAKQAFSLDKVELLNKQIDLMKQQQKLQHGIADEEREQLNALKSQLQSKGFLINVDNEILNYEEKLLALEKNVEALREKSDNSKDDEGLKKQYENANEELGLTKKYLSEFIESNKQLSSASAEWWELSNNIQETKEEIYDILNQNIETEIDDIADSIDFLSSKIDNLNGQEKIKYIQQQNALYKQQQQLLHQLAEQMRYQLTLLDPMSDKYKELSSAISDLSAEWWELQSSIQDNQMEIFEEQTRGTRNEMDELSDTIDFLDSKIENLYGTEKINYINQQSDAYREQQQVLHILAEQLRAQRSQLDPLSEEYADLSSEISDLSTEWWELQEALKDNQMEVFEEQVRGIKNHINELSDSIDFLDEKMENLNGTEKIHYIEEQNALYKRQQEVLHELAEQMRYQLTLLDPLSDEYADLSSEIKGLSTEWWELENAMKDNMFEIFEEQTEGVRNRIDDITNSIDFLDAKMDNYSGEEKIAILEEQNSLYKTQQNALHELAELLRSQLATLDPLSDEYQDMENDISDLSTEWWELEKAISGNLEAIEEIHEEYREALRDQLDATKDIEEEITKVYEKEYEKRKKELEDYYDKRTKLLNEEKEAYKEMRDEQEYEKGLQDQTDEIGELRKKLEIAKRDNSIEGLKRQKELAEELAEAEENLAKYTQDKIDSDYEKNIDNEIDRLEEEKTELLGALEEQFSEINIAKLVQSALSSGFVEINGEVKSLQDLLIESINDTTDAYSVMGATIKQEMVDNLSIALDTMKELESIYKDLNIKDFGLIPSNMSSLSPSKNYNTNTRSITVGETNITINGSVSNDILNDIEDLIEQKNNEMLKSISKGL